MLIKADNFLRIAQWNADGIQNHKEEIILQQQKYIDMLLFSETHFTTTHYFRLTRYKLYYTNHPDGTAHGGTAILIKKQ
jgi:exonuclease III